MKLLTSAVAAVITDPAGRVLLCQQRQGHRLWALPGGKIRDHESPLRAAVRDIQEEVGVEIKLADIVGLYQLTSTETGSADDLPDCLVHVFRAHVDGEVTVNSPGHIARLSWHDPSALPERMTATTRTALEDAAAGRAGVLRTVHRDAEPEIPEATGSDPGGTESVPSQADHIAEAAIA
jgi:8-oxo-dGTP pyrophosphatase MutT (NUDIX family)